MVSICKNDTSNNNRKYNILCNRDVSELSLIFYDKTLKSLRFEKDLRLLKV